MGAIDNIHIAITKPSCAFAKDYFYHKTIGYNIVVQAMVNSHKRFIDLYMGLHGSVDNSRVLKKSRMYYCTLHGGLFDMATCS
jgi:hypothetical protein